MIGIYLIGAFAISIILFFSRTKLLVYSFSGLFLVLQSLFTIYTCFHFGSTELIYFTFDSLGVILLITLSIVAIPAMMHSYIYIENHKENSQARAIYLTSMVLLITAISAGYLSNHIAVTWIFTEITTLSASALIYHHRNKLALEGSVLYLFFFP